MSMKHLLVIPFFLLAFGILAQPGMYTEADMEFQDIFIKAQLAKYKGDVPEQISLLETVIKRQKNSDSAYNELSRAYLSLADYELAEKYAVKAHDLAPQNEWYLLNLAEIYDQRDNFNKAMEAYGKLKEINPKNPTIYHNLALIQTKSGKGEDAAKTLEALQAQNGQDEETTRRIFDIYRKLGKEDAAVRTLRNFIADRPEDIRLLNNLALYLTEIGKQQEATKVYEQIISINPKDPAAAMALAKKDAGVSSTGDTAEGGQLSALIPMFENMSIPVDNKIKELMPYISTMKRSGSTTDNLDKISLRLSELYPDDAKVYALRGDVLFYQGDFQGSEKNFKKAISIDDRNFALWSQYMLNLYELSDYKSLLNVSEEAVDLYPNKVTAFIYYALALHLNGDIDEATDLISEASMIAGSNTRLKEQALLAQLWIAKSASKDNLQKINLKELSDPLFLDLAADLYKKVDKSKSISLWKEAMQRGANPERINKKIDLQ